MSTFTLFANSDCGIAENPLWNPVERKLYWKGSEGRIFRKSPGGTPDRFECFKLPVGRIGGFVFRKDGGLLVFAQHGRVWRWSAGTDPVLTAELPDADDKTYFNDLIVDPEGRIFCETLAHDFHNPASRGKHGALWRFDPDGSFHCLDAETGTCPNGMGFSPDMSRFYFAVTDEQTIYRYEYDRATGGLGGREAWLNVPGCDGMTVDSGGSLWIACRDGLTGYSPRGEKQPGYGIPSKVRGISSVTFGGPDLKTVFVTTFPGDGKSAEFLGGGVFALHRDVAGVPEFPV